jgi:uncharacterized repeat protein (TIGR03847 family)
MSEMEIVPDIFTADYEGEPGERIFFVQARGDEGARSFRVEKQQVTLLAEKLRELLLMIDPEDTIKSAPPERDPSLELEPPEESEWRIGTMGLAYDEENDRVVLFAQPAGEEPDVEPEDEIEDLAGDGTGVRFLLRRDQVRAFVLHALAVVQEGRPICPLCGLPMNPSGHRCPASNGHHVMA